MNSQTYNCWVCNQGAGPLMPLNQGGWQAGEPYYIHTMCFLFFDHGDWTYDGHNYVMRNDQIFFAQTKSCFSCKTQQRQRLVKCHEISCQNFYHIGCLFKNQMVVFENKQHNYKMARLVILCPQHIQYGQDKERREHITKFNFQNLDSQIIAILNDHIAQKEKSRYKKEQHHEKKSRKKERKRSHSRQRSRSRSYRKKRNHRSSRDHKPRKDRSSKKHRHHDRHSSFSEDEEQILTFSSSDNDQKPKKLKNLDDEFFNRIVGEEEEAQLRQRIFKPNTQPQIQEVQWIQQIQIKKKSNSEKQEIEPPKQQNSLDALAQQKRLSEATKKEQDIMVQKELLEDLIKQQSTFYIDNTPKFTQVSHKTILQRKQRLLPLNQKEIFNMIEVLHGQIPLYPFNVSESKRDVHVAAWWECLSMLFFQEADTINQSLLSHSKPIPDLKKWYEANIDQEMFQLSQQAECYEPMIFTNYSIKDSINVLYRMHQSRSLFIYRFDPFDDKKYDRQIKLSLPQIEVHSRSGLIKKDKNSKYKDHYGQELTWVETMPLTQEEFQECLAMDNQISLAKKEIEEICIDDEEDVGELDICYTVLKNQLNQIVLENNMMKSQIMRQIDINPINIQEKIKQQNLLMDYLRWQQVVTSMKNGYADKTLDILSCFYRLPTSIVSAHKEKQKGLVKMQSLLSKRNEKPLDTDCKVCFDNETSEINPVIYCDECQTSFHRLCYGIQGLILDHQDFLCDGCRSVDKNMRTQKPNKVACQICGKLGLPQKLLKNKFYHVACLILTNMIMYENGYLVLRNGVTSIGIQNMVDENEGISNQCAICGKSKGYKLQCNNNTQGIPCRHSFHPMCAYLNGIKMEVTPGEFKEGTFTRVTVKVTCALHIEENFNNQILQVYYRFIIINMKDVLD